MGLFQRTAEEHRTIDEILTPKVSEEDESAFADEGSEVGTAETVASVKDKETRQNVQDIKNIQIETPEEIGFNALSCFGWSEGKTPKWLVSCARVWYWAASFMWFLIGCATFAPVIFLQGKLCVVSKNSKKTLFMSIGIYSLIVAVFLIILIVSRNM